MGSVRPAQPAKLFAGLLAGDSPILDGARTLLEREFGSVDFASPIWPFTATDYYRDELGDGVMRQFLFFERLIDVGALPEIKLRTNALEAELCDLAARSHDRRPVNIDPGYMTLSKLVLATTKDYTHRLYLGRGIYGEVTLHYQGGRWESWPWTYVDYAADTYHAFFRTARTRLRDQLATARTGGSDPTAS